MTKVFLSGSRKINRINDAIRQRIDNILEKNFDIIVGDANGADKAMQSYLADRQYPSVTVYFVGTNYRNNVGEWTTVRVPAPSHATGREFYTLKDKEMARDADFGLVLWDGKSPGSISNVLEMLKIDKKVVVYFGPEKQFYTISNGDDVQRLIEKCEPDALSEINRKVKLAGSLRDIDNARQSSLVL
ncbi:hypothetical protein [Sphingopyxis sp.]|uniref:hypothetical protein n=1 Tax=Sphingopyxis sp. TaxID=1908224 RepID=UPI003D6D83F2